MKDGFERTDVRYPVLTQFRSDSAQIRFNVGVAATKRCAKSIMDSNSNPQPHLPSFCSLSQAYLTNPIGLPANYPWVVRMQMVDLLNFHPAIPFVLVSSDSMELAEVLSVIVFFDPGYFLDPIEQRRMHSRFATNWLADTFLYETRYEFGAASSLRSEAR